MLRLVTNNGVVSNSLLLTGIGGLFGLCVIYAVYRHWLRDIWVVAATVLSACLILEAAAYRVVLEAFEGVTSLALFSLGWATLIIFSAGVVYLRSIIRRSRVPHA